MKHVYSTQFGDKIKHHNSTLSAVGYSTKSWALARKGNAYRQGPLAVAALEACLVVGDTVGGQEVDEMDGLVARLALVLRAGERHGDSRRWSTEQWRRRTTSFLFRRVSFSWLAIDVQARMGGGLSEERAWHLENGMETAMADALKWPGPDGFGSEDRRCMGSRPHRPSQAECYRFILGGAPSVPGLIFA
jgi:hypothetical protein